MTEYTRDDRFNECVSFYLDKGIIFSLCVRVVKNQEWWKETIRAAAPVLRSDSLRGPKSRAKSTQHRSRGCSLPNTFLLL